MSIQLSRNNEPDMNCAVSLAQNLERRERARGFTVPVARRAIARKIKTSVGTIENLVRGRIKRVDAAVRDRLQALLVSELEQEIARLTHELAIARQTGLHPASDEISEVETLLARATQILAASGSGPVKRKGYGVELDHGTRRTSP